MNRLIPFVLILAAGCTTVPPGHRGVQVYFGDLKDGVLVPGFYSSMLTNVVPISVQVQATEAISSAVTNDLQNVNTQVTLNWSRNPDAVHDQYEKYPSMTTRIINPAIQESVKSVTAQFTATDLVQRRQEVKDAIEKLIGERLAPIGVTIDTLNITDFAFSEEFNLAIESKVRAEQEALRAKEELEKTKIVAQQAEAEAQGKKAAAILEAEGEAKAIAIRGEALRANPQVLELRRIETWNGVMPTTLVSGTGGGSTLLNVVTK
ncbi:MAG: prohibitin family protein [Rhodobacterales bacterium]|nr:prohibitin family protein [Rhodobacterales bacterium]